MNQILEMISQWNGFGQAIFFLMIFGSVVGTITQVAKYIAICVRGWPVGEKENE